MTQVTLQHVRNLRAPLTPAYGFKKITVELSSLVEKVSEKQKDQAPCFLVGPLSPRNQASRGEKQVSHATVVAVDFDNAPATDEIRSRLQGRVEYALWETASSQETVTRLRLVVSLCENLEPSLYPVVYMALADLLAPGWEQTGAVDRSCARVSQKAVRPCRKKDFTAPYTEYQEGPPLDLQADWFNPYLQARLQQWRDSVRSGSRRPREEQEPLVRAFNEVYEDLGDLSRAYGDLMGCRYEPSGPHSWTWVGADGTRAVEGGLVESSQVKGAYVDFYASSPTAGRVVFPFDILMAQSRLHSGLPYEEVMPKDSHMFSVAAGALKDVVSRNEAVQSRALRNSHAALQESPAQKYKERLQDAVEAQNEAPAPSGAEPEEPSLAVILATKLGKSKRATLTTAECRIVREHSKVLKDVWRDARDGSYYWTQPDGSDLQLDPETTEDLFEAVIAECGPIENITKQDRRAILHLTTSKGCRVRDRFREGLEAAEEEWRRDHVVRLTDEPGGIHPGAEDTRLNRLYLATFVRAIAARTLFPGIRFEHMLVLQGRQAGGKTSLLTALSGAYLWDPGLVQEFAISGLGGSGEGVRHSMLTRLGRGSVALLDEVAAVRRDDQASLMKAFLSQTSWSAVGKYQTMATTQPINYVLAGTTNSRSFLPADDGIRRYMVYEVTNTSDPVLTEVIAPGSRLCRDLLGEATAWVRDTYQAALEAESTDPSYSGASPEVRAREALARRLCAPFLPGGTMFREHVDQASRFITLGEIAAVLGASIDHGFPDDDGNVFLEASMVYASLQRVGLSIVDPSVRMALEFHVNRLGGEVDTYGGVSLPASVATSRAV